MKGIVQNVVRSYPLFVLASFMTLFDLLNCGDHGPDSPRAER